MPWPAATDGLSDLEELSDAAEQAISEALRDFRDRPAGLGRARMYGEASIGLDDPGMLAVQRMLAGLLAKG